MQKHPLNAQIREQANRHLDVSPARMQLNQSQSLTESKNQSINSPMKHQVVNEAAVQKKHRGVGIRVQSLQSDFDECEICQKHPGQPNIAMDRETNTKFGCNKCVFAKELVKPMFLAGTAKNTKIRIDQKYQDLNEQLHKLDSLQPAVFQNKLNKQVTDFFQTIYKTIKDVEREVLNQVKNSDNLKQLRRALDELDQKINHSVMDQLEDEKKQLDLKIEASRYAYVVQHKEHFEKLEHRFDSTSTFLKERTTKVEEVAANLLQIEFSKNQLATDLIQSVNSCIVIDGKSFNSVPNGYRGDSAKVQSKSFYPFSTTKKSQNPEESKSNFVNGSVASFKNVSDFDGKQTPINLRSSYPSRVPESAIQIKDESGRQSTGKQMIQTVDNSIMKVSDDLRVNQQVKNGPEIFVDQLANDQQENQNMVIDQGSRQNESIVEPSDRFSQASEGPPENFYTVNRKTNQIMRHSFRENEAPQPVIQITHVVKQHRLVQTHRGRLFVLSGQPPNAGQSPQQASLTKQVKELVEDPSTQQSTLEDKQEMLLARTGFGCLVDHADQELFVVGGNIQNQTPTSNCEVYDLINDSWKQLPSLNKARVSTSLVTLNEKYLYAFGGYQSETMKPTNEIERINTQSRDKWELLSVKIPTALAQVGAYQQDHSKIILFGGYNQRKQTKTYLITEKQENKETKLVVQNLPDNEGDLQNADTFNQSGCFYSHDDDTDKVLFAGQDYLHEFDMKTHKFTTVRKIEQK